MMRSIGRSRGLRALSVLASACALALTAVLSPVAPAAPAEATDRKVRVSDEAYYSRYNLEALHAQGYTGEGVTIAVIDGRIDTSIPELQGADIVDKSPCAAPVDAESDEHATYIAQLLVAPDFGIAPKATIYNYVSILDAQKSSDDCSLGTASPAGRAKLDYLIEQAINDGADIISISSTYKKPQSQEMRWAISRATVSGVPIVAGAGNDRTRDPDNSLGMWGGVIGVSALDKDGNFADYSNYGEGVTVSAVGVVVGRSTLDNQLKEVSGTSFAAPMVAGFLALAWQRFGGGEVSVYQLLQAVLATAWGTNGQWNERTGYGEINPAALLAADPSQYPEEIPLLEKGSRFAFHGDDLYDYYYGLANPRDVLNDDWYVYRGVDEESALSEGQGYEVHLGTSPLYHYQG
ncbi:S8 family serine peptidase [Actinomyces sp. HMSC035G02]|uniref:S8 family peptidase n=1 Tax=Actinomyces sp. HMSC035G02 TaxID=1739406 RepID=UPI0008A86162|nr:S8 family serine peptidase [Actinomyces sp. HMSC035G02]OHR23722.1 subtilisin BPN [Actinomyces sp. HMSC035G02]